MVRYDEDFYAWSQETAQALLEGRFNEVDLDSVAEEILDLSKSEARAIDSRVTQILLHLLKIQFQPDRHTRSWDLTIAAQQVRLKKRLADSPSLRARLSEFIPGAYEEARLLAARQTEIDLETFPEACPFTLEEITGETGA